MGAWIKKSQSNTVDGAGSAVSLFRRWVYFTFQSPLLLPKHSSFSRANPGEGGLTRATKNLQHSGFLPQVGLSSEAKLGTTPALTPSQTQTHMLGEAHAHSCAAYLSWKLLTFGVMCVCGLIFKSVSRVCFNIFGCTFYHLSLSIYAYWGNNTGGYLGVPFSWTFCHCFASGTLLVCRTFTDSNEIF